MIYLQIALIIVIALSIATVRLLRIVLSVIRYRRIDQLVIQEGVDKLYKNGGGTIHFAPGIYIIDGTLHMGDKKI